MPPAPPQPRQLEGRGGAGVGGAVEDKHEWRGGLRVEGWDGKTLEGRGL